MARMKPGDPHQMWYQDFWNQFGCSTSKWSIGPLGETCHTKSHAFVLINKATMQLVWAGEQGQPLTLADYAMGKDADLTRRCTLFDQVLAPLDAGFARGIVCCFACLLARSLACTLIHPTTYKTPTQQIAFVHAKRYADILITKEYRQSVLLVC